MSLLTMNYLSAVFLFPNYAVHFFMSPQDGNVANSIQHYAKCQTKTMPHRAFFLTQHQSEAGTHSTPGDLQVKMWSRNGVVLLPLVLVIIPNAELRDSELHAWSKGGGKQEQEEKKKIYRSQQKEGKASKETTNPYYLGVLALHCQMQCRLLVDILDV